MHRLRPYRNDLMALALILALALLWFAPVLLPFLFGRTLLPWDILYTFAPFNALRPETVPQNGLLADMVLQNVVWKQHIREALAAGDFPLWNAEIFTGIPFLAGGQASTFYPLNLLFYILPLDTAYGWFTALQVALAGMSMYVFARVVRMRILAALFASAVYMFSGFLIVSVVFTMFVAAVPWLPLLLAIIEIVIRKQEEKGGRGYNPIPWVLAGSAVTGMIVLAGHPELIYYSMLVAGAYALVRLIAGWRMIAISAPHTLRAKGRTRSMVLLGIWLLVMVTLGVALGAVQLIPLVELLPLNFREGSATLAQVREWAWPSRHILTFALPDIFGNPSHHNWFDIWNWQWVPATVDAHGNRIDTIFWGIKNYVEGGNYVGVATWLLTAIASLWAVRQLPAARRSQAWLGEKFGARPVHFWFFAALIVVSLLFAFGTPLYAILYHGLPGWNQLHSPFRWVFPMTLALAFLGGMGLDVLLRLGDKYTQPGARKAIKALAGLTALAGAVILLVLGISIFLPDPFITLGQRIVDGSDLAQGAFSDGRMFWGYQSGGILRLGVGLLGSGALVWLLTGADNRRKRVMYGGALIALVVLDLYSAHGRFNPSVDTSLDPRDPAGTPPVVSFLNEREAEGGPHTWRFTTFNLPGEKTFNPNVGMYYGWQDIRGYDSIIPRQYVDLMELVAPQENELLYNRIAPLYTNAAPDPYAVLESPLLDMLNVKYVLTEHVIPNATWQEVYRDASIGVYENLDVLPRVRLVDGAQIAPYGEQQLLNTDLRNTVFIEETPPDVNALNPGSAELAEARISLAATNNVLVDVNISDRAWLLLADAYFPGWKAYIRPFGTDESQETELQIYRANSALRAVYLPDDGQWTVRFVYSPMSFKLGMYVSFLAFMALLFLGVYWLWGKFYRPEQLSGEVHVVAKNSLVPMGLNLANKAIDFAFAMLYVRLLGPEGTGKWYFVVTLYGFFEIISRYGLGTLLTRDVAEDKNRSSRYLTNTLTLRTLLWLAMLPILALVTWFYANLGSFEVNVLGFHLFGGGMVDIQPIGRQEIEAIAILAIAMLFANYADVYSSMFFAFEKMEYPAGLSSAAAMVKVSLGALVLLMGWSFVGLAIVSLIGNILQMIALWALMRITLFKPQWRLDGALMKEMLRVSGPLMINNLLATIFWRIDVWILRPLAGAVSVGLYSVGLKYIDGLNIIPSMFTLALFPFMSRNAKREGNLLRTYVLSIRLLLMVSLPIAAAVTFLARDLVYLVGGAQYLDVPGVFQVFGREIAYNGGADLAFQFMIWSIPIGFVNSVTQYVLIAVHQQHYLTRAFVLGVLVNLIGNLILIPRLGYVAAAVTTIFSEFCLLLAFYWSVRKNVGAVPWLGVIWRPVIATAAMLATTWALLGFDINVWLAVMVGGLVYLLLLIALGALRGGDMDAVWRALPIGPLRRFISDAPVTSVGSQG